jgi:DNA-binding CsgD family transcriptional regulator
MLRERLDALADAGLGAEEAQREAIALLRRAIGFERWCWPVTDPGSAVSTGGIAEFDLWSELPRIAELEEHGDVTSRPGLVLGDRQSVALSAATGGDLARSRRWRECLKPYGVGDELMTVCRDRHGCWGSVELMRDSDDRPFDEADVQLLHELAPTLGRLLRRSAPRGWGDEAAPLPPATLILDRELRPTSWTPAFRAWGDALPPAVYEIGARVRAGAASPLPAVVRIRTPQGWAAIEGAQLQGAGEGHVAITLRAATADEIFDLLCMTYDLSRRERQLVALVLDGLATKQLAVALSISPHTVQDHLKSVFAKTGARTRGELRSRLAGPVPQYDR